MARCISRGYARPLRPRETESGEEEPHTDQNKINTSEERKVGKKEEKKGNSEHIVSVRVIGFFDYVLILHIYSRLPT